MALCVVGKQLKTDLTILNRGNTVTKQKMAPTCSIIKPAKDAAVTAKSNLQPYNNINTSQFNRD